MKQPQRKKLLLLVTDGEPADIDERAPQAVRFGAKKAIGEPPSKGVGSYCLTVDPEADDYVARIFDHNRYTLLDQVQKFPENCRACSSA